MREEKDEEEIVEEEGSGREEGREGGGGARVTLDTPIRCTSNNNHCSITDTHRMCRSPR